MKIKRSQLNKLITTLLIEQETVFDAEPKNFDKRMSKRRKRKNIEANKALTLDQALDQAIDQGVEVEDEDLEGLMKSLTGNIKTTPESNAIYINASSIIRSDEFKKAMNDLQPEVKKAGDTQTRAYEKVNRSMDTAMAALRNGKISDAKENFEFALEDARDIRGLANVDALMQGIQAILKGFEPGKQAEVVKDVFTQFQDIATESTIAQYLNAMKQDLKYYENASLVSTALIAAADSFRDKNNTRAVKQLMTAFTSLEDLPDSAGRRNAFLTLTQLMSLVQGQIPPKDKDQQQKLANSLNKNKDAIVSDEEEEEIKSELQKIIPDQDKTGATKTIKNQSVYDFQGMIGMQDNVRSGDWSGDNTDAEWAKWLDSPDTKLKLMQLQENLDRYIFESTRTRSLSLIMEKFTEEQLDTAIAASKEDATALLKLIDPDGTKYGKNRNLTALTKLVADTINKPIESLQGDPGEDAVEEMLPPESDSTKEKKHKTLTIDGQKYSYEPSGIINLPNILKIDKKYIKDGKKPGSLENISIRQVIKNDPDQLYGISSYIKIRNKLSTSKDKSLLPDGVKLITLDQAGLQSPNLIFINGDLFLDGFAGHNFIINGYKEEGEYIVYVGDKK